MGNLINKTKMKFFALCALVASTNAALGDDCFYDTSVCNTGSTGHYCASWNDSQYGEMASCEDCSEGNQFIQDSYGDIVEYICPPESYPEPEPEVPEDDNTGDGGSSDGGSSDGGSSDGGSSEDSGSDAGTPATPAAPAEEEGSSQLVAGAAALLAAVSIMA